MDYIRIQSHYLWGQFLRKKKPYIETYSRSLITLTMIVVSILKHTGLIDLGVFKKLAPGV